MRMPMHTRAQKGQDGESEGPSPPEGLRRIGCMFGGVMDDYHRRIPHYWVRRDHDHDERRRFELAAAAVAATANTATTTAAATTTTTTTTAATANTANTATHCRTTSHHA